MTKKKITRVGGDEETPVTPSQGRTPFVPTPESKGKAKQLRLFAILAWVVAIALQAYAIFGVLLKPPVNMTLLIILIVIDLGMAITGSILWKKANRLDPASEKDKLKFFMQNQLGAIMAVLAFLPLVILIFTSKDLSGKQKGLAGSIAVIALLIAGIVGIDFNPPSVEQYTEQTAEVETLNEGFNHVYWTKSGTVYHIYSDCHHINRDVTTEIFEGTVAQARELKNITELCKTCRSRAMEEKNLTEEDLVPDITITE
ncbi:MAG: hypothetical protein V2I46_08360 [Bacteroides sp.]|jgi:hypothetical protein|nr:hypothetical protein [Bacteroides sp.]